MSEESKILIGKIVAPQGLRGEVRVHTFTADPADLATLKIEDVNLKFVRAAGRDVAICKIDGINDRTAAEEMRGTELFTTRESLPELSDDEFYITDLIGMMVIVNGEELGKIESVQNYGAGDILELESGKMISFEDADVDLEKRTVTFLN